MFSITAWKFQSVGLNWCTRNRQQLSTRSSWMEKVPADDKKKINFCLDKSQKRIWYYSTVNRSRHFASDFQKKSTAGNRYRFKKVTIHSTLNLRNFHKQYNKIKPLYTAILRYTRAFATFPITHFQVVEAIHYRFNMRIFNICQVRHHAE